MCLLQAKATSAILLSLSGSGIGGGEFIDIFPIIVVKMYYCPKEHLFSIHKTKENKASTKSIKTVKFKQMSKVKIVNYKR